MCWSCAILCQHALMDYWDNHYLKCFLIHLHVFCTSVPLPIWDLQQMYGSIHDLQHKTPTWHFRQWRAFMWVYKYKFTLTLSTLHNWYVEFMERVLCIHGIVLLIKIQSINYCLLWRLDFSRSFCYALILSFHHNHLYS